MTSPLTTPYGSPSAANAENARYELQAKLAGIGDLRGKKMTPEQKEKKLREACEGFESVFIQKMWQEMRNTLPKGGLLHGREEKFWQDMYDQELSKKMTSAGGIGLADMMYAQLSRNLVSASRSLAGASGMAQGTGFTPSAAPLLPEGPDKASARNAPQGKPRTSGADRDRIPALQGDALSSIYEGYAPQHGVVEEKTPAVSGMDAVIPENAGDVAVNPPEVEQALLALRQQQAINPPVQIEAVPAGQGARREFSRSGMELARIARQEAGTKLGPGSVRPPLQPSVDNAARQTSGRKVRYTTNVPKGRRHGQDFINTLQAGGQAAQNPPQGGAPAQAMPVQNPVEQGIPPLTALDIHG
jgi:Rod binding domain-containing protein